MSQNVGRADRVARVVAALVMLISSVAAPVPLFAQIGLALMGVYLLGSSLVGTCLGYRLMGVSTCPLQLHRARLAVRAHVLQHRSR